MKVSFRSNSIDRQITRVSNALVTYGQRTGEGGYVRLTEDEISRRNNLDLLHKDSVAGDGEITDEEDSE